MNKSYSKIRHIQESNQRLENRLLTEQSPITQAPTGVKFTASSPKKYGNAPTQYLEFYVNKVDGDKTGLKRTAQLVGSDNKGGEIKRYLTPIPFTKNIEPNFDFTGYLNAYPKEFGKNFDLALGLKTFLNSLSKSPQV